MSLDLNIIIDNGLARKEDESLFFGDLEGNTPEIFWMPPSTNMIDILAQSKIFASKGQAKKNGWADKSEIPEGFSEFTVGKLKHRITILKVV